MTAKRVLVYNRPLITLNDLNDAQAVAGELAHYDIVLVSDQSGNNAQRLIDVEIMERTLAIRTNTTNQIKFGVLVSMLAASEGLTRIINLYGSTCALVALVDTKLASPVNRQWQIDMYSTAKALYRDVVFLCDSFSDILYAGKGPLNPSGQGVPFKPSDVILARRRVATEDSTIVNRWLYDELLAVTSGFNNTRIFGNIFEFDTPGGTLAANRQVTQDIAGFFNHAFIGYNTTLYNSASNLVLQDDLTTILHKPDNLRYLRSKLNRVTREDRVKLNVGSSIITTTVAVPADYEPPTEEDLLGLVDLAESAAAQAAKSAAMAEEAANMAEYWADKAEQANTPLTAIGIYVSKNFGVVGGGVIDESRLISKMINECGNNGGGTCIVQSLNAADPVYINTPINVDYSNVHLVFNSPIRMGVKGSCRINGAMEEFTRGDIINLPSIRANTYNNADGVMVLPMKEGMGRLFLPGDKIIVRGEQDEFSKPYEKQITFVDRVEGDDLICTDEMEENFKVVYPKSDYPPDRINGTQVTIIVSSRLVRDHAADQPYLEVIDGSLFKVGEVLMISDSRTEKDLDGITTFKNAANLEIQRCVRIDGNKVYFEGPTYRSYSYSHFAVISKMLTVKNTSITANNKVYWTDKQDNRNPVFLCSYGENSVMTVKDVNGYGGRLGQTARMAYSYNCVVKDSVIYGAMSYGSAEGYGVTVYYSTLCKAYNNKVSGCRHNFLIQASTAIDIHDNDSSDDYISGIDLHGTAAKRCRVYNNRVTRSINYSPDVNNGSGIRNGNTAHVLGDDDTEIYDNYVEGYRGGNCAGIDTSPASKVVTIRGNHLIRCNVPIRVFKTNDNLQPRPYMDLLICEDNTFEDCDNDIDFSAIYGLLKHLEFNRNKTINSRIQIKIGNVIKVSAVGNYAVNPVYIPGQYFIDVSNCADVYLAHNIGKEVARGIRVTNCPGARILNNEMDYTKESVPVSIVNSLGVTDYNNYMGQSIMPAESLKWRGEFVLDGIYNKGEIVGLNGSTYICIKNGIIGEDPTNSQNWNLFSSKGDGGTSGDPFKWVGPIVMTTTYYLGDTGSWGGSSYRCVGNVVLGESPPSSMNWAMFAQKGVDGRAGNDAPYVELQKSNTAVQWKYNTEQTWRDLVLLSEITGPQGRPGSGGGGGGMAGSKTIAIAGDSITANNSAAATPTKLRNYGYFTWIMILAGFPLRFPQWNFGVGGDTTKMLYERINAILAAGPDLCIVEIGINDTFNNLTPEQSIFYLDLIYTTLLAAGIAVMATTIYPVANGRAYTDVQRKHMAKINSYILGQRGLRENFEAVDIIPAMVDYPQGGFYTKPGLLHDYLHPGAAGAFTLASVQAPFLKKLCPIDRDMLNNDPYDLYSTDNPYGAICTNGMLYGAGGTKGNGVNGQVADAWDVSIISGAGLTVNCSKANHPTMPNMEVQVIEITGTATSDCTVLLSQFKTTSNTPASGLLNQFAEAYGEIFVENASGFNGAWIDLRNSTSGSVASTGEPYSNSGSPVQDAFLIPAGSWHGQFRTLPAMFVGGSASACAAFRVLAGRTCSGRFKISRMNCRRSYETEFLV